MSNAKHRNAWQWQLRDFWNRITTPVVSIDNPSAVYKARVLASVFLATILLVALFIAVSLLVPGVEPDAGAQNNIRVLSVAALFAGYWLCRRGHDQRALVLGAAGAAVILFMHALAPGGILGRTVLYYQAVVIFVCGLFIGIRVTLLVFALQQVGFLILVLSTPNVQPSEFLLPNVFSAVMTFFVVVGVYYRSQLDDEKNARIRQNQQRLSTLVEQMPLAVIELDLNSIITGWNPAAQQIFGYTPAEALGKDDIELLVPDHLHAPTAGVVADLLSKKGFVRGTNENKTRDGRVILCEWFNILLTDAEDKAIGIISVATDITERHQADEQRLKLSLVQERMLVLKRFMDALSHDFRTALSQIETSRYLLERGLPPETAANLQPRFDNIAVSVRHMATQLGNLNTISALSDLNLVPCDLNRLVRQLVGAQDMAHAKNLSLRLELAADLPTLLIDDDKLHDALLHLLDNAIAYTPAGGSIRLRTRFDDQQVYVDVMDNGIGIDAEHLSGIFDLFYRVDDARPLNTGGVGLGLSIVRLVAEAHGGSITVTSTPGQGSTFTLTLPVTQQAITAELAY